MVQKFGMRFLLVEWCLVFKLRIVRIGELDSVFDLRSGRDNGCLGLKYVLCGSLDE